MADTYTDTYKSAKEAFHADNPGTSVHFINAVSLTALSAYAVYAAASRRVTSPAVDWVTMALPLLLGVTVFAETPLTFNAVLIGISLVLGLGRRGRILPAKPAGRWLNESDSEDEGDMDDGDYHHSHEGGKHQNYAGTRSGIKLPSEVVAEEAQRRRSLEASMSPSSSSGGLMLDTGVPRRRASPSPVLTGHATIDIAASPPASPDQGTFARAQTRALKEKERERERGRERDQHDRNRDPCTPPPKAHLPFLTVYRSHMMIMTVHCILAVDFPIFPRVLGKCEDFGTSLMDVGVGSFVFSLGIVSSKAFAGNTNAPWIKVCLGALRNAAPVLLLGFIRLLMVKGVEYPEHLTEYGVHWNFFFTLGLVPALCSMLLPLRRTLTWPGLAVLVTVLQQILLSGTGLQDFLLSSARPGLLGANKEGIASVPGYLAIFMIGLSCGDHVLRVAPLNVPRGGDADGEENGHGKKETSAFMDRANKRKTKLALELGAYAVMAWAALGLCNASGIATSRRFANLPYVLWTVAYNASYLTGYLALELLLFTSPSDRPCPPLLDAVNKNGLAVFLVANLLTGFINVSFQTMYASTTKAMFLLAAYSAGVCAIAWVLRGIRIKI